MHDIFEEFYGADLDRLTDCLTAVRNAGLSVSKHTQAGVNPSSGNVWVWSDDWRGCVYCSIGFHVAWLWTCPECGEEFEFDTYAEMETFADKQAERYDGCKSCCNGDDSRDDDDAADAADAVLTPAPDVADAVPLGTQYALKF